MINYNGICIPELWGKYPILGGKPAYFYGVQISRNRMRRVKNEGEGGFPPPDLHVTERKPEKKFESV
jgi:hypothetical protein